MVDSIHKWCVFSQAPYLLIMAELSVCLVSVAVLSSALWAQPSGGESSVPLPLSAEQVLRQMEQTRQLRTTARQSHAAKRRYRAENEHFHKKAEMEAHLTPSHPGDRGGEKSEAATRHEDYMREPLLRTFGRPTGESIPALSILTWNIERGSKMDAILEALQGPLHADLYALQEVDRHTRRSGYQDLPEKIARQLGADYVFGAEFEELAQGGGCAPALHGQMILSRLPILHTRILRFRHQPHNWGGWWKLRLPFFQPRRGGRMALFAELQWHNSPLVLCNTHLESRASEKDQVLQMREILADVEGSYSSSTPMIIAGDFNTKEGNRSAVVRELRAAGFHDVLEGSREDLYTSPRTKRRLDWVFVRGLCVSDARVHALAISDHFPVTATVSAIPPND